MQLCTRNVYYTNLLTLYKKNIIPYYNKTLVAEIFFLEYAKIYNIKLSLSIFRMYSFSPILLFILLCNVSRKFFVFEFDFFFADSAYRYVYFFFMVIEEIVKMVFVFLGLVVVFGK